MKSKILAALESIKTHANLNATVDCISSSTLLQKALESQQRWNFSNPLSKIDGTLLTVKCNIASPPLRQTCASKTLATYTPEYTSTVCSKIQEKGGIIVASTNADEFGMGSTNSTSFHGPTLSLNQTLVPGGSSGGAAVSVASGMCDVAVGSDTGGSVRLPASYCNIIGFKPSYGRISRHGLVTYASSFDTIGLLSREIQVLHDVFDSVQGVDPLDSTTCSYSDTPFSSMSGLRIGIVQEFHVGNLHEDVLMAWSDSIHALERAGAKIVKCSLPNSKHALATYYALASVEAASNLAKFDGVRYGYTSPRARADENVLYAATRTESFGSEVKKRITLGTWLAQTGVYEQGLIYRQVLEDEFQDLFKSGIDFLVFPASCIPPPPVDCVNNVDIYGNDVMTVYASLLGAPALVLPFGRNGVHCGIQIVGARGDDYRVLGAGKVMHEFRSHVQ